MKNDSKWGGGNLYQFCFIFWIVVFVLYMVIGENTEKIRKIWLLNKKGIQFLGMFEQVVSFNVVYMQFEMFCFLELLIGCILKFIGNKKYGKVLEMKNVEKLMTKGDNGGYFVIKICLVFISIHVVLSWLL